jgi:hypothetical protein
MMNWLAEIMPLFFVRWYAQKYGERQQLGDETVIHIRPDIFVSAKKWVLTKG